MTKNMPERIILESGTTYFWCSCGLSAKNPFCDGTHKNNPQAEGKKSLHFTVETTKSYALCTCKETKTPPFCDGSHKKFLDV